MSTKPTATTTRRIPKRKPDARIERTREALGDAIIELMQEKAFEEITVQHVLDRAGVSRSTFYVHYRDKNDLFLSDVEDFWQLVANMLDHREEKTDRVAAVRELFAHVSQAGEFYKTLKANGRVHDVMELGQGHIARGIEKRLARIPRTASLSAVKRVAMSHALSGSLFSLLTWWLNHGMKETPKEMDEMFHEIVWKGV